MKRAIFTFTIAAATLTLPAVWEGHPQAQATEVGSARPLGLGFALGSPAGLVGKYFLGGENAIDFGISFFRYNYRCDYVGPGPDRCRNVGVSFFADYLWQYPLARGTASLDWHFGPGARIWLNNYDYDSSVGLAARMPVGLDLTFDRPEFLELFFEIAPALYLIPGADLEIEAAVGVRFYF